VDGKHRGRLRTIKEDFELGNVQFKMPYIINLICIVMMDEKEEDAK